METKRKAPTYTQCMWLILSGSLTSLFLRKQDWQDLGKAMKLVGMVAVSVVLRLIVLGTAPVSVPLLAWLVVLDNRKREVQEAEARAKMRKRYESLLKECADE